MSYEKSNKQSDVVPRGFIRCTEGSQGLALETWLLSVKDHWPFDGWTQLCSCLALVKMNASGVWRPQWEGSPVQRGRGRVGTGWSPRGPLWLSHLWLHHSDHSPKAESDLWCSLSFWVCRFVVVVLMSTILLFLNRIRTQVFQGYTRHPLFPNTCTHLVSKNALSGSHYWSSELVGKIVSEPVWGKQAHACQESDFKGRF